MRAAYAGNGSAADELGSLLDIEKWPAWLLQAALQYFAVSPFLCINTRTGSLKRIDPTVTTRDVFRVVLCITQPVML